MNNISPCMDDETQDILRKMGILLLLIQSAERVIKLCMRFVIQEKSPMNYDLFQSLEKKEQRKTLGYFLAELRKRTDVEEGFDNFLKEFLDDRNNFVHDISKINGWNLHTEDGRKAANIFLDDMILRTNKVMCVFAGFITAWQKQIGMRNEDLNLSPDQLEVIQHIGKEYSPLIDKLLSKKTLASRPAHSSPRPNNLYA